ncbi:putative REJ domain-containing protein [Seiridium cardinale]|uniref:REJ domain-containing protein n=1 Tax=Seiridium cardinale TaxID=138064 RepID=A0ABR2XRK3_9PEZI
MVNVGAVSCLLLVASSVVLASDAQINGQGIVGTDMMSSREVLGPVDIKGDGKRTTQPLVVQVGLHEQIPTLNKLSKTRLAPTALLREPQISPSTKLPGPEESLHKRQNEKIRVPAAAVPPSPGDSTQTLGPIASAVSASLSSSAAAALASVSADFQGQLGALSAQSSADVAAASAVVSASASAALASVTESAAAAMASISASASSAIASADANTASIAASASIAAAAASSSAAASARSAIAAVQSSLGSEVSMTMPSATAAFNNNNIVQPNSSASSEDAGSLLITPSQIAAMVIGTIVGTAIFTLLVVYAVVICRQRREKKHMEKYRKESKYSDIALNAIGRDDETGRAEGYSSRYHRPTAHHSEGTRSIVPVSQVARPQKAQLISHRPSLPPLQEESPRVSDQFDLYPPREGPSEGLDFHALSYTPEQTSHGMPEEPDPVKLALIKRRSRGGSQRLAVTRVGSVSHQGHDSDSSNLDTSVAANSYFSGPLTPGQPSFKRPRLARTPSSDTLPHPNRELPSPLASNSPINLAKTPATAASNWGWGAESSSQVPLTSNQYQNLNAQVQPDYPYTYRPSTAKPQYIPDRNQPHIGFLLQQDSVSPRPVQQAQQYEYDKLHPNDIRKFNAANPRAENMRPTVSTDGVSSPIPLRPINHISISPISPYSSTFENPLASPNFISPLSPPPKSPLRAVMRLSKSDYALRGQHNVSPLSSDDGHDSSRKATPPLPLRRFSRSSGELGAVGLAQATAGLDLNIGPSGTSPFPRTTNDDDDDDDEYDGEDDDITAMTPGLPALRRTDTAASGPSRASSLTTKSYHSNTNPNGGGRFTFLASNGHTPDSSNRSSTPTSPWGPLPSLRKRRSSSLGRIEIPPEQLTVGGIYVGAPGPKFVLFPRSGAGGSAASTRTSPGAVVPVSPFGAGSGLGLGLGHGKSRSMGSAELRQAE